MRSYEYMDPAKVLEIRGEDCANCKSLGVWILNGTTMIACDNLDAPIKKRECAPASRCHLWEHKQQDRT